MHPVGASSSSDLLAVVGVMTSAGASGQANAAQYLSRRTYMRNSFKQFANLGASILARFIMAKTRAQSNAIDDEQHKHADIVFLPLNESRFNW
jgi:hypothetical protein